MLQEAFDLPTTQILSLFALSKYLATKPDLSVCISNIFLTSKEIDIKADMMQCRFLSDLNLNKSKFQA